MAATYNLKNATDYKDFKHFVIEAIESENEKGDNNFPLDDCGEPITVDYLWEEFGGFLDGTQSGLGYQVFSEIIQHYETTKKE